jgi:hypothetical protein
MDREYLKNVTNHFKNLKENHQATLDFLKNLRQTPEFSEYRFRLLLPFLLGLKKCNNLKSYKNSVPFLISRSFNADMTWRNIVTHWLSDKIITQEGNLATLDLMKLLIEKNIIPVTLIDNPTLHSIILTQIILETLTGITVLRAPQGNTFTYRMNAREMMMWDMARKN